MIKRIENKIIKGKLSQTWLFRENKPEPEIIPNDFHENDDFIKESGKEGGKSLYLNLDILEIKDLSIANSLNKIIMVLNNGFIISQAFMFCIGKLEKEKINKIFNYLYEIYHKTKNSQNSFLSNEIKLFRKSFEMLCSSLAASGVGLRKFDDIHHLKKKTNIIINQEKPSLIIYHLISGINWKGKMSISSTRLYKEKKKKKKKTKKP